MNPVQQPQASLKRLRILATTLIAATGILVLIAVAFYSFDGLPFALAAYSSIVLIIAIAVAVIAYFFARRSYEKKLQQISSSDAGTAQKLNLYAAALILYMAPCEGAGIFSTLLFLLTGYPWLLLITLMMMLAMAAKFPTRRRVTGDLQLNWQEQQEFE